MDGDIVVRRYKVARKWLRTNPRPYQARILAPSRPAEGVELSLVPRPNRRRT